jgi:hypothetical protein
MMPMRLTVAGEAFDRFSGSKKAFIEGDMGIRSPFARVSSLFGGLGFRGRRASGVCGFLFWHWLGLKAQ